MNGLKRHNFKTKNSKWFSTNNNAQFVSPCVAGAMGADGQISMTSFSTWVNIFTLAHPGPYGSIWRFGALLKGTSGQTLKVFPEYGAVPGQVRTKTWIENAPYRWCWKCSPVLLFSRLQFVFQPFSRSFCCQWPTRKETIQPLCNWDLFASTTNYC